jgi:hypothetical protein
MGAALATARLARRGLGVAGRLSAPALRVALDPPLVPPRWRPLTLMERWGREWQERRSALVEHGVQGATHVAASAAEVVLPLVDLTPLVNGVLERLDLDAVAAQALADLDLATVVTQVIDELDVGLVVNQALDEVDLTGVVVEQVDLGRVVGQALEEVDLTEIVLTRVDLAAVVLAALDTLDLTELVTDRVDLAGIAEDVIEQVDLPDIIQESTGSVASEAVQSARLRSVTADEKVSALADRVLLRVRRGRAHRRNVDTTAALEGDAPGEDDS